MLNISLHNNQSWAIIGLSLLYGAHPPVRVNVAGQLCSLKIAVPNKTVGQLFHGEVCGLRPSVNVSRIFRLKIQICLLSWIHNIATD